MKIKTKKADAAEIMALPGIKHGKPKKQSAALRALVNVISKKELKDTECEFDGKGFDLVKDTPCLVIMNHSCFLDLQIAFRMMAHKPFNIVCTSDGFVGKSGLMYSLGCIPTEKFVSDLSLIRNIRYALEKLYSSVLLYPEASYSFDGTATPLPETVGALIKMLKVPVVSVMTEGAFLHDPLYNGLQLRKTKVKAVSDLLFSSEQIKKLTPDEINAKLKELFSFDNFKNQKESGVLIAEPFRADGLHRVLYKCPHCKSETGMKGEGEKLVCADCGAEWTLEENGELSSQDPVFTHIPDWYKWEREQVREEIISGEYKLDIPVDIRIMTDMKYIYEVGEGRLTHGDNGFSLRGCGGAINYDQSPLASYSVYSDYFWYEIGDMICIGTKDKLFYCFPQDKSVPVAKIRLAAEELYKKKRKEIKNK